VSQVLAVEPLRVVVWTDPGGSDLARFVEGQLSDLAVEVEHVALDAERGDHSRIDLRRARRDGAAAGADVVAWAQLDRRAGALAELRVYVLDVASDRVFVRVLGGGPEPAAPSSTPSGASTPSETSTLYETSALYEAAALVARTTVRSILEGEAIGVTVEEAVRLEPLRPADAPTPEEAAPEEPADAPPAEPAGLRPWIGLGWLGTLDGATPWGAHAGALEGGTRIGALAIGLTVAVGLPAYLDSEVARFTLTRHAAMVGAAHEWALGVAASLELGLRLGAALLRRDTVETTGGASPTDARTHVLPLVGPEATLVLRSGLGLAAALRLAVDFAPVAPGFGHENPDGQTQTHTLSHIQPSLLLSVRWDPR
jgi:hypothetical protein